ncbi:MAG: c-type cytochrome domain-containing protein, partial [Verrucomicrobiota bacterium]|nr:c-type cytochrome domain-containing protein [Verrucomicrobiota bacterium]
MQLIAKTIFLLAYFLAMAVNMAADENIDFFEKKIRPVLINHCYKCHSAEAEQKGKLKGRLRLDLREAIRGRGESGLKAVVPGKPDESNLYRAITYLDPELVMPPKTRLDKGVVKDFKRWIEMEAPDPRDGRLAKENAKQINFDEARKFWSFRKPSEPTLPPVQQSSWPREDLDLFILAQLEASQLRPASASPKRTLIRRATYDLTGLPPTMEEVSAFLADKSP